MFTLIYWRVRPHRGKRHEYPDTVKICLWKTVWTCPGRHIPSLEVGTQGR
jgi:hypothetical protein